ncbi:SDR family NAD(P)-dependent oxidoreductase [Demequina sp. NBRC 110056]|uniref:SDR family NAD(P)-dependent oxidoreductase n=1 Tax=Demequina sp. NBRC 110056 TaxID=1570345 RepID=UPI0009FC2A7B|nr:SDR family oxidoreductase [Demequina sp. NBRC 110056]
MTASTSPLTLITGGGRGIGRAIAERLACEGHGVAVGYASDEAAAAATVDAIVAAGGSAFAVQVDVTDAASVAACFDAVETRGALTGVVANAGAVRAVGRLADLDPADLQRDLDVNLLGAVLTCREAARRLSDGGAVVLISSVAAALGSPGTYVHYAAAKAGTEALTVGLSKELAAAGVRVNAVAPGTIRTDFHLDPGRPDKVAPSVPLGRPGEPHEIAGAVAWLLSPDAAYATGTVIRVSGGL